MSTSLSVSQIEPDMKYLMLAASRDSTRTSIRTVHVDAKGNAVTTDGHRLHIVRGAAFPKESLDVDTAELLGEVIRKTSAQVLYIEGREYRCAGMGHEVTIKASPAEDHFPKYERIIPKWAETAEAPATDLRRSVLTPQETKVCVFTNSKGETWHLSPEYVKDALTGAGKGTVKVHFSADDMGPIGFSFEVEGRERFALIMPLRK